jgi:hypothetical protein
MFVVLHLSPSSPSHLAAILQRRTKIPIAQADDGEPIRRGQIYLARPDYHLVVEADRLRLPRGPRENRHRPAIDALFRSAAYAYGGRVIGVLLTGAEVRWIREHGSSKHQNRAAGMGLKFLNLPIESRFEIETFLDEGSRSPS